MFGLQMKICTFVAEQATAQRERLFAIGGVIDIVCIDLRNNVTVGFGIVVSWLLLGFGNKSRGKCYSVPYRFGIMIVWLRVISSYVDCLIRLLKTR